MYTTSSGETSPEILQFNSYNKHSLTIGFIKIENNRRKKLQYDLLQRFSALCERHY